MVARMVASNLSTGGLYCTSNADFAEMTRLSVRLLLPTVNGDSDPIDVDAVVVRRREVESSTGDPRFELALFFPTIDDTSKERISRFLDN